MIESERPSVQIRIWLLGPFLLERRTGAGMWEPIAKKVWNKCGEDTRQRLHHLKQSFSPDLQAFAQHLLSEPSTVVLQAFSYTPTFSTYQPQTGSLSLSSQAQDIMGEEQEEQDMDRLRRQISQQVFNLVGATFIGPQAMPLMIDNIAERLSQTLNKPSTIDSKTLFYLERRVGNYWRDRNDMVLPAQDLLPYIMEDLQKFITLLDRSMLPNARTHLCSITGTAAMLVGELYFDMGNYIRAQNFQDIAITAAHEANNAVLEAVAWARKSFACTYNGNRSEALTCLQIARHLAQNANSTVRAWLAAVEAEIQANLGDRKACSEALREGSLVEDQKFLAEDCYWIHFDSSLAAGYQGISFLKLSSLGQRDLLLNAQTALYEALNLLHPSMKRRQPTILIDLAGTYVQQRNIEQACTHALQAMHLATQIKSQVTIQRFLSLRNDLKSWEETQCIKDLDQSIGSLLLNSERH